VGSGAEPQSKLNLVHFSVKYDIWWEQMYLFCKELTDQIQCSLSNKSKKAWRHHKFKNGATSNLRAKRAKKNWSIAEWSHFVLCVFWYFRQFAFEKNLPPSFQFFTFPQLFPGGICLHRSMERTPLAHGAFLDPRYKGGGF